ncbi:hypothetical protein EU538_07410, partial [Candidatus Thorarchaeota archaeon]
MYTLPYITKTLDVRRLNRKRTMAPVLLVAVFIISLVASSPSVIADTATPAQDDVEMTIGMFDQPDYLSPVMAGSIAAWEFINWIYDPIVRWDDDWGVMPGLAESWDWAENGTQLTLHLVENATWHDGTPFTSADVNWTLFTWTWLGWWAGQTINIDHRNIKCPDNYTVVLNFVANGYESIYAYMAPAPYYYYRDTYNGTPVEVNKECFLTGLTYVPILPKHLYDPLTWHHPVYGLNGSYYDPWGFWDYLNWDGISWALIFPPYPSPNIGTGMFILQDYEAGEYAVFEGNDDYHWGAPAVDNLTILFYTSVETMTQALKAGEIDFCETTSNFIETGTWPDEVTINENSFLGWEGLLINQNWEYANNSDTFALREQSVKEAINQAVNKTKIAAIAYLGHARAADSVIHSELKWFNDALELRDAGVAEAKATLEADGWTLNEDDIYEKELNGSTKTLSFSLQYVSGDPIDLSMAQLIEADLEEAGIDVTLTPLDVSTFTSNLDLYNYELMVTFYSQIGDPNSMAQYMTSDSWLNPTSLNVSRVDDIYMEQKIASDAEREDLINEMQQLIYDEASVCILAEFNDIEIYRGDRWAFTNDDWLSGILSIWNWEPWLT